jgi:YfiH family protein
LQVNPAWLVPDWPAPTKVKAVCTTRAGGTSIPPYHSFNLGEHVGDNPVHVSTNRASLVESLGARPVFMNQVHGSTVLRLDLESPHGLPADACMTNQPGVACTVMVADCLPVLLSTRHGYAVAAAHAGWRGLLGENGQGVLEQTCKDFSALALINKAQVATEVVAWLGPCIGPAAFEVGDQVRTAFAQVGAQAAHFFKPKSPDKYLADLAGLARWRLAQVGITQVFGNDGSAAWCTVSNPSKFFSFRRDGDTGRMAACIWIQD